MAEAIAFGSLLSEGYHVRLSGQDIERGTFSHRHAVLVDQETEAKFIPLNNCSNQVFSVSNSNLSEFGVLGFELGFSLESPNALIVWEAQFGDFSNGAQVIIDQFITGMERKWQRQSGIVLLLPHGFEGQGPEHSSGRVERFLQMTDEDADTFPEVSEDKTIQIQDTNMQVVNCSTAGNYFHVLRRQLHRSFRKPLVVMTPKAFLRDQRAASPISEFTVNTKFNTVINDPFESQLSNVRRLVFCSGKVYYDIDAHRDPYEADGKTRTGLKYKDVVVTRIEQLAPFPFGEVFLK